MTIEKQTITVYNKYMAMPSDWAGGVPPSNVETWVKTVLKNCQVEDDIHINPDTSGKSFIDKSCLVIIPHIKRDKPYLPVKEWDALPSNQKSNYWTLSISGYIAIGDTPDITSAYKIANLIADYKVVMIKEIADLTNGPLPHFEVQGI